MRPRKWSAALVATVLAVALGAGGCTSAASQGGTGGSAVSSGTAGASGSISVAGSDTMVNMAQAWAEAYMQVSSSVSISVKGGGSGTGIAAFINGTVDFADSSRDMKPEEIATAKGKSIEPVQTKVARDGVAIVVNPANPVTGLTLGQLGGIYRGEITNWKQVGGADKPIVLLSRDSSSGTYEFMLGKVVGSNKRFAPSTKLLASNQAIADEVKGNDAAIGYIGVGYESPSVKVLAVDGVKSSVDAVANGTYVLSRYLFMISNGRPTGVSKSYIDWILGPEGQKIVKDSGFVPLPK